jgi:signal transduction histidine kinase
MALKLKIFHKGILLVALPSLFQVVFVVTLSNLLEKAELEAKTASHSKEVIASAMTLTRISVDAAMTGASLGVAPTPEAEARARFIMKAADIEVARLAFLCAKSADQKAMLRRIQELVKILFETMKSMEQNSDNGFEGILGQRSKIMKIRLIAIKLDAALNKVIAEESAAEEESGNKAQEIRKMAQQLVWIALCVNISLAGILALYFTKSVSSRLLIVQENTSRLARKQQLVPSIEGDDEIAELDQAFHKAADELKELEQFKQQLIGIVSHELKTPLSAMQVNIALMAGGITGELPPKAQQKVKILDSNVNRLIRLINDLLDIDKLEAGKFELVIKPNSVQRILESAIESVRAFAEERKVEIDCVELSEDLRVEADMDRIVQVVVNLLSNAVKYSPEGSRVRIEALGIEDIVEVRVTDLGRGIPETHISRIFDRFQQVESSDAKEKGGTGLGLAICKAIIEQHGGTINVHSTFGKGSVFFFRLKKANLSDGADDPTAINLEKEVLMPQKREA